MNDYDLLDALICSGIFLFVAGIAKYIGEKAGYKDFFYKDNNHENT